MPPRTIHEYKPHKKIKAAIDEIQERVITRVVSLSQHLRTVRIGNHLYIRLDADSDIAVDDVTIKINDAGEAEIAGSQEADNDTVLVKTGPGDFEWKEPPSPGLDVQGEQELYKAILLREYVRATASSPWELVPVGAETGPPYGTLKQLLPTWDWVRAH